MYYLLFISYYVLFIIIIRIIIIIVMIIIIDPAFAGTGARTLSVLSVREPEVEPRDASRTQSSYELLPTS